MDIYENSDVYQIAYSLIDWFKGTAQGNTLFLTTGGSAMRVIAKMWGSLPMDVQARTRITLTDERYGPVGHADSNWKQLQDLGFDLSDSRHVPVLRPGLSMEETTAAWGQDLEKLLSQVDSVIAIFGIGTDSHIAGIKPDTSAARETTALTACFQGEDFARITIAPPVFKLLTNAAIYTEGAPKREVLNLLKQDLDPIHYPDQLIKQTQQFRAYYKP